MKASKLATSRKSNRARLAALAIPAALAALALAGCTPAGTNTGSSAAPNGDSGNASGDINIVVIGGASDDSFFSTVKRGVDDAKRVVEANGGKVTYLALQNYNNLGPDVAQLIKNAAGQNPSAIAVPDWVPEAEDPAIKEVIASGVPVIIYNAGGIEAAETVGALTYIGTDEFLAGVAGGEAAGEAGVTKAICVNTVPGAQNLEDRCAGYAEGLAKSGGTSTQLALPASNFGNQTAVAQAIKAALAEDPTVDGLVTVGGSDVDAGLSALEQSGAGEAVKYVHFNTDTKTLTAIQEGTVLAGIDQQPYAQGYYSVSAAFQYAAWGIELPTKPILTGPLVITQDNVEQAISGAEEGVR
jgi:simple sugar transport system substrate-binding protein